MFKLQDTEVPIIAPVIGKGLKLGFLAALYRQAMRRIALADELVVVGCSLRPSDQDIRKLLSDGLSLRASTNHLVRLANSAGVEKPKGRLLVTVVDPDTRSRTHARLESFINNLGADVRHAVKLEPPHCAVASSYFVDMLLSQH
jgi:hypothetical protein